MGSVAEEVVGIYSGGTSTGIDKVDKVRLVNDVSYVNRKSVIYNGSTNVTMQENVFGISALAD